MTESGQQQNNLEESWGCTSRDSGARHHDRQIEEIFDTDGSVCARADSTDQVTASQTRPSKTVFRNGALHPEISHNVDMQWLENKGSLCDPQASGRDTLKITSLC